MAYRKYKAKKTVVDGITFDSKKEACRYQELKLMEKAGQITDLKLQPKFQLQAKYRNGAGKAIREVSYIADFQYKQDGKVIVEDVKGVKTEVYKLKKKMFEFIYYPQVIKKV